MFFSIVIMVERLRVGQFFLTENLNSSELLLLPLIRQSKQNKTKHHHKIPILCYIWSTLLLQPALLWKEDALQVRHQRNGGGRGFHLPDAHEVNSASDLFDQHRGQSFRPKLLVYAQEIDLHRPDRRLIDSHPGSSNRKRRQKIGGLGTK